MSFKTFPNPSNDAWLVCYNKLVSDIMLGKKTFSNYEHVVETSLGRKRKVGLGKHHIIPKSLAPDLEKDPENLVVLPFAEHMDLHYFLWRSDPAYASQLWFGCVFGRKHKLWDLPGGDAEYETLKADLKRNRRRKINTNF